MTNRHVNIAESGLKFQNEGIVLNKKKKLNTARSAIYNQTNRNECQKLKENDLDKKYRKLISNYRARH